MHLTRHDNFLYPLSHFNLRGQCLLYTLCHPLGHLSFGIKASSGLSSNTYLGLTTSFVVLATFLATSAPTIAFFALSSIVSSIGHTIRVSSFLCTTTIADISGIFTTSSSQAGKTSCSLWTNISHISNAALSLLGVMTTRGCDTIGKTTSVSGTFGSTAGIASEIWEPSSIPPYTTISAYAPSTSRVSVDMFVALSSATSLASHQYYSYSRGSQAPSYKS